MIAAALTAAAAAAAAKATPATTAANITNERLRDAVETKQLSGWYYPAAPAAASQLEAKLAIARCLLQ